MQIKKIIYNLIAKHLPLSHGKINLGQKRLRCWCASGFCKSIGDNVNIEKGAYIPDDLIIGDNSGIGVNAEIGNGTIIGKNVLMGPNCIIYTSTHNYERTDIPIGKQGMTDVMPVTIGDNVWIGTRVIIMPGISIGKGAIIGAGAVVTHDVPDFAVVGGVPATVKKYRK